MLRTRQFELTRTIGGGATFGWDGVISVLAYDLNLVGQRRAQRFLGRTDPTGARFSLVWDGDMVLRPDL
jgi:hypothetical protein